MDLPAALDGVRVLDLADESGALCGKLLADMGADVILVEPPQGARMRGIGPFYRADEQRDATENRNRSLFFWHYNTNKRGVTLDLERRDDRQRFLRLATISDIIVETAPPGYLGGLGLGYADVAAVNPR